jgi:hypothetical protein
MITELFLDVTEIHKEVFIMRAFFHSEVKIKGGWEHYRKLAEVECDPETDKYKFGCEGFKYQNEMGEIIPKLSVGTKLNYVKDSTEKIIVGFGIITFDQLSTCLSSVHPDVCRECVFYYIFYTEFDEFVYEQKLPKSIKDYRIVFWITEDLR